MHRMRIKCVQGNNAALSPRMVDRANTAVFISLLPHYFQTMLYPYKLHDNFVDIMYTICDVSYPLPQCSGSQDPHLAIIGTQSGRVR